MTAPPPWQPRPAARRARWRAWRWVLLFAGLAVSPAQAEVAKEYQVKAAFLFNFTKFVEWPRDCFPAGDSPIVIAVLGRNPFGDELEAIAHERLVGGRPVVVRRWSSPEQAKSARGQCHVLFVAAGAEPLLADLAGAPVRQRALTVGESERFAALGGMVNFVVVEGKVRFEINRAAAEAAGLKLAAQLQKLAVPARPLRGGIPP